MFKRLRYWKTYRAIDRASKNHDWRLALVLAKRIGDDDLVKWIALARVVQVMNPNAPQPRT